MIKCLGMALLLVGPAYRKKKTTCVYRWLSEISFTTTNFI